MDQFLALLKRKNEFDAQAFYPVIICGHQLGFIHHSKVPHIIGLDNAITVSGDVVTITPSATDPNSLTTFFKTINEKLVAKGLVKVLHNGEMCPVRHHSSTTPLFHIYRYALAFWGMRLFAVHLNGLVRKEDGLYMWVGKRAMNQRNPGEFDHIVCGAVVSGLSMMENLYKEAEEEIGMGTDLLCRARSVGVGACTFQRGDLLLRFTPFMYDLELPIDYQPKSKDGSISTFFLMNLAEFITQPEKLLHFKSACQVVIINLLVRHGYITPDHPSYMEIIAHLLYGLVPFSTLTY